jgi:hypothetical protein
MMNSWQQNVHLLCHSLAKLRNTSHGNPVRDERAAEAATTRKATGDFMLADNHAVYDFD